uniref:LY6/PLAUR domain containing 6B n=1 Tax=Malurus cyaneus samueli TaxID=2593467 RepID=A0A8C5U4A6_9PASS
MSSSKVSFPWMRSSKVSFPWMRSSKVSFPWMRSSKVSFPWIRSSKVSFPSSKVSFLWITLWNFPIAGAQYCLTIHLFTAQGQSTSVTKKCATGEECHLVGCQRRGDSGHTECVSCCEGMICNVEIPTNATNAVLAVLQARRASGGNRGVPSMALLVALVTVALP